MRIRAYPVDKLNCIKNNRSILTLRRYKLCSTWSNSALTKLAELKC